jgi:hypothetical protein
MGLKTASLLINRLNFLGLFFSTVQAIASPKQSAPVDFNILINFQHLNEDHDEKATARSGLRRIEACNFFSSECLFHSCEDHSAQDSVHF